MDTATTNKICSRYSQSFLSETAIESDHLKAWWLKVKQAKLTVSDGVELAYCYIKHPESTRVIVISNGRTESYLKYKELIFDLYGLGYSIYAIDHRGQGLSSRLTTDPHRGHVEKFDNYINDFKLFVDTVVLPKNPRELFLIGHSMGATIATLYLDKTSPTIFDAAVFSAPMYGINFPINKSFIRRLAILLDNHHRLTPNYVIGGKGYRVEPFENNPFTHSKKRYYHNCRLYQGLPKLQLGSPTNRWLIEAIDASERAIIAAKSMTIPTLILQSGQDAVVDNRALNRITHHHCKIINIDNARHEVFIETDALRTFALTKLAEFFDLHGS